MAGVTKQVVLQWVAAAAVLVTELQITVLQGSEKGKLRPQPTQSAKVLRAVGSSCPVEEPMPTHRHEALQMGLVGTKM